MERNTGVFVDISDAGTNPDDPDTDNDGFDDGAEIAAGSDPFDTHQANAREAELGAHDRSDGAADVEGREGVRPRTSRSVYEDTRRLGDGSIGRVDEKAVLRVRSRKECSHAALCAAAEVSIHVCPGLWPAAWRSDG